jgi:hypothetical protein
MRSSWPFRVVAARSAVMRLDELNVSQWITTIRATLDTTQEKAASCACEGFYAESATHSSDECVIIRRHSIEAGRTYAVLHGR